MSQGIQPALRRPVVLVTGCSNSGIGSYLAKHFALNNCITYAAARDTRKLTDAAEHGCIQVQMDICSLESIQKAVEFIISSEGRIDILVNNAGVNFNGPVVELDIAKAANVLDTNVLGALRVTQAVAPTMIKNGSGTIVNVGSIVGDVTVPWGGIYSASKAALHSLTDALRLELRPFNIDVVVVKPGAVTSSIAKNNLVYKHSNNDNSNVDRMSILVPDSFYKEVEGFVLKRVNISQELDPYDTDKFGQKVVSWVLGRRNPTMTKLGYWLNPANVALGFITWGIGRVSPKLAPSMSYFNGYGWTLSNELVLGGGTWAHTISKYLPNFARDAALWSKFGLGMLAIANNDNNSTKED